MVLLAFILAYAGFALLALSMARHQRQLDMRPLARTLSLGLRFSGYGLLASAWWPCFCVFGLSVGVVAWLGLVSAAAFLLVGLLAWRPQLALLSKAAAFSAGWMRRLRRVAK